MSERLTALITGVGSTEPASSEGLGFADTGATTVRRHGLCPRRSGE